MDNLNMQDSQGKTSEMIQDVLENPRVLSAVKKYCSKRILFRKIKPGEKMNSFYDAAMKLTEAESEREHLDTDKTFTVLSNMLLILDNLVSGSSGDMSIAQYDADRAVEYLETSWHIDQNYAKTKKAAENENDRRMAAGKIDSILKKAILLLAALLLVTFLVGLFLPKTSETVEEAKPFYTEAYDWIRFNVFGEQRPAATPSLSEKYQPYTYMAGWAFLLVVLLCLVMKTARYLYRIAKYTKRDNVEQDWKDFHLLESGFRIVQKTMTETEMWEI